MVERVKRTYKLRPRTAALVDEVAEQTNSYKSQIVEEALEEYLDNDRAFRIETKLDAIATELGIEGDTLDLALEEKEKLGEATEERAKMAAATSSDDDEDDDVSVEEWDGSSLNDDLLPDDHFSDDYLSYGPYSIEGKQTEGTANRMANYLALKNRNSPLVDRKEILTAIKELGGETDHFRKKYMPLVESRLDDMGWIRNPLLDTWYSDEDTLKKHLESQWNGTKLIAKGAEDIGKGGERTTDEVERMLENESAVRKVLDDCDIEDKSTVKTVFSDLEQQLSAHKQYRKKAWGDD